MSKKFVAPFVLVALTATSTAVLAASQTKTGDIQSTDATKHELILVGGDTFQLGKRVTLNGFKAGDKVAVTYKIKNGKMMASKVSHTK